jgi:hypothetical protein
MEMWTSAIRDSPSFLASSRFLQGAHPPQARRGRQTDAVGQILVVDAPILLQDFENMPIKTVQCHVCISISME